MMPAVGAKFVLLGASEEDLKVLQEVDAKRCDYDGNGKANQFSISEGSGEANEDINDADFILDLRSKGELRIFPSGMATQAKVLYKEKDRTVLLEQILLMLTGEKFLDADLADMMPILEKGCFFYWNEVSADEIVEKGTALVSEAIKVAQASKADVFLQICGNGDLVACAELLAAVEKIEGINMLIAQGVSTEAEIGKSTIVVFATL